MTTWAAVALICRGIYCTTATYAVPAAADAAQCEAKVRAYVERPMTHPRPVVQRVECIRRVE
jgi:hypothetical protein